MNTLKALAVLILLAIGIYALYAAEKHLDIPEDD